MGGEGGMQVGSRGRVGGVVLVREGGLAMLGASL